MKTQYEQLSEEYERACQNPATKQAWLPGTVTPNPAYLAAEAVKRKIAQEMDACAYYVTNLDEVYVFREPVESVTTVRYTNNNGIPNCKTRHGYTKSGVGIYAGAKYKAGNRVF